MANHDNWRELCADLQLENDELREKLRVLGGNYNALAQDYRKRARDAAPTIIDPDEHEYECGECSDRLDTDWVFCPGCGCYIEWDKAGDPEPDDSAYDAWAEEQAYERWKARQGGDAE